MDADRARASLTVARQLGERDSGRPIPYHYVTCWYIAGMEITGIDAVTVDGNFLWPLIRVETDAGIHGIGEVRDHGKPNPTDRHSEVAYLDRPDELALQLERHLIGKDPRNIVRRFEDIRRYGGWGRMGGGVSAIEMALFDLVGKDLGVPAWQLLGGNYRDEVRVYVDCRAGNPVADSAVDYGIEENDYSPEAYAEHAAQREAEGFDFVKFDLAPQAAEGVTGEVGVRGTHLTAAGLAYLEDVVSSIRSAISPDTDLGFDCASVRNVQPADVRRLGQVLDAYDVSAYEDARPDRDVAGWEKLTDAIETPTITGEDLYTLDGFRELIRREAVDLVGPDLLTAGGIRETVRIGDFANQHGIAANLHFAGSPVGFMASLHAAAAIPDVLALEFHAIGVPWWEDLVEEDELFKNGYATVPDRPGLGVTLDHAMIEEHSVNGKSF